MMAARNLATAALAISLLLCLSGADIHLATAKAPEDGQKQAPAAAAQAEGAEAEHVKTVRVVDEAGQPVVGATVVPWAIRTQRGAHGPWTPKGLGGSEPPTLTTDADGKVKIQVPRLAEKAEKIAPKELTCRVLHSDFAETMYNDVAVTDDAIEDLATIVVKQGALVEVAAFVGDKRLPMDRIYALCSSPSQADRKDMKVNAKGELQLPRLPAGEEYLRLAYVPAEGPSLFSDVQHLHLDDGDQQSLSFEMKPAVTVEGKLDESVPRPVKNGRLVASVIETPTGGHSLDWRAWTKINEDGSFKLEAMPEGNLQIIALCDGFMAESGAPPDFASDGDRRVSGFSRPQVFAISNEMHQVKLAMTPTSECLFRVVGPDGRPVAKAKCHFWPNVSWWSGGSQVYCSPLYSTYDLLTDSRRTMERFRAEMLFSAETDADGKALVKNLPPNSKNFIITHDDFELPIVESKRREHRVDLAPGEQREVTATLQRKGKEFVGEDSE